METNNPLSKLTPEQLQQLLSLLPLAKKIAKKKTTIRASKTNYLPRIEAVFKRKYPFS